MRLPPALRRLTALVPAVLMVLASLGLAPTAFADTSDNISLNLEFKIHENKTVDITMIVKGDDASSNCDADDIEDRFDGDVKVNAKTGDGGDSCTIAIKGLTLKQLSNSMLANISHKDDSFTFKMDNSFRSLNQATVKVTFPGSVSKVSGDGKKSGNTATWNNAQDETGTLTAKGADHGSPLFTILIVVVIIAAIGGGAAAFIIIRQKRTKTGIAPGYPQPGQQPYIPQPGYAQPGQTPAPGAAQPGYYAQPGAQQPYNPQQPYSPQSGYGQPGQ